MEIPPDELRRLKNLWRLEDELYDRGFLRIAGVDEAGRGPLAGPVTAACVILPRGLYIPGVNDSKKISAKKRAELSETIKKEAISYNIASVSECEIDEINILNATHAAMKQAVAGMGVIPGHVLIDGRAVPDAGFMHTAVIGGDGKNISIAAASIIAKVRRDELMVKYAKIYPEYGFEKHKGYGTAQHIEALKKYGPCPIHRKTFIKGILSTK